MIFAGFKHVYKFHEPTFLDTSKEEYKFMKKLLYIFILSIYIIVSFKGINIFKEMSYNNFIHPDSKNTVIGCNHIKEGTYDDLVNHLLKCAKKNNVNITTIDEVPIVKSGEKNKKIIIYTSLDDFSLQNIAKRLKIGRNFVQNDNLHYFISSRKTDDVNQIGQIAFFNNKVILEIRPFEALKIRRANLYRTIFNTTDENTISSLRNDIENKFEIETSILEKISTEQSMQQIKIDDFLYKGIYLYPSFISVIYVLILFIITTMLFFRYKEFAIKKILGYKNSKIIFDIITKDIIPVHILGIILSSISFVIYLAFYGQLSNTYYFIFKFTLFICLVTFLSIVGCSLPCYFVRYGSISEILKNKKPINIILNCNMFFKIVTISLCISSIVTAMSMLKGLHNVNEDKLKWIQSANFGYIRNSSMWEKSQDLNDTESEKYKKFFQLNNSKGGIYVDLYLPDKLNSSQPITDNQPTMVVNNNYLLNNPVYDINGNQINIPEHFTRNMNILVPEKLRNHHNEIYDYYRRLYIKDRKLGNYDVNILYVQNNQKLFTYNIYITPWIYEPIIEVISYNNMPSYFYFNVSSSYYPKFENIENPYEELKSDLVESGIDSTILSINSLYNQVADLIERHEQQTYNSIYVLILYIVLLILCIAEFAGIYFEKNKYYNSILKIYGYKFIKRITHFFIINGLVWVITISCILIFNFFLNQHIPVRIGQIFDMIGYNPSMFVHFVNKPLFILVCFFIIDLILSGIFIKFYEKKKITTVLKGE